MSYILNNIGQKCPTLLFSLKRHRAPSPYGKVAQADTQISHLRRSPGPIRGL